MLVIRQDQMLILQSRRNAGAAHSIATRAARRISQGASSRLSPELDALMHAAIQRARGIGLVNEAEIWPFIELCLDHGWDFDSTPWVQTALTDTRVHSPFRRLLRVADRLTANRLIRAENEALRGDFTSA